jgi:hypothetical protein
MPAKEVTDFAILAAALILTKFLFLWRARRKAEREEMERLDRILEQLRKL